MTGTNNEPEPEILKQDRLGRVRTPREKREEILDELERSGMSAAAFAERIGVKYQTLANWKQKRRKARRGAASAEGQPVVKEGSVRWLEVAGGREAGVGVPLVVSLGGGVKMEVCDRAGAALAAEIIRGLSGWK